MDWIIAELIAFLEELRGASAVTQALTLLGIPGAVGLLFGGPWLLATRRTRAVMAAQTGMKAQCDAALEEVARLKADVDRLEAEAAGPAAFLKAHAREMRDQNPENAMALAEDFVADQRDALLLAFRTRMEEAVGQAVEDGAPGFATARAWALAALALDPQTGRCGRWRRSWRRRRPRPPPAPV